MWVTWAPIRNASVCKWLSVDHSEQVRMERDTGQERRRWWKGVLKGREMRRYGALYIIGGLSDDGAIDAQSLVYQHCTRKREPTMSTYHNHFNSLALSPSSVRFPNFTSSIRTVPPQAYIWLWLPFDAYLLLQTACQTHRRQFSEPLEITSRSILEIFRVEI